MDMDFQALEDLFPMVFGDWHIVRKLGKGSYCDVYEVSREIGGTKERKALKHISFPRDPFEMQSICSQLGTADSAVIRDYIHQSVEMFEREYLIMSDLGGQTNTVSCQDMRKIEKKDMPGYDIFFFMELLTSVATISTERAMSEEEIVKLGIDICTALELLEKRNILHRDIKPENLFINKDGDYKLGDFGAAKLVSGVQSIVTTRGTPAYMPPEIAQMRPAGTYSDIYSLGLVMYRLLNNNLPPFADDSSSMSTASLELVSGKRLTGEKLPKPANGSKALQAIVLKACEFEPEKRYQKAAQMRTALEALQHEAAKAKDNSRKPGRKPKNEEMPVSAVKPGPQPKDNVGRVVTLTEAEKERIKEEERLAKEKAAKEAAKAAAKKKEDSRKKLRKALITVAAVLAVAAVAGVIVKLVGDSQKKKNAYKEAVALFEGGKYDAAGEAFAAFEDTYEDTATKKKDINDWLTEREKQLTLARQKAEEGEYGAAIKDINGMKNKFPENRQEELNALVKDYTQKLAKKNADEAQIAKYEATLANAKKLLEKDENTDHVIEMLQGLINNQYETADVKETFQYALDKQKFLIGKDLLQEGKYQEAIDAFTDIGSFTGADAMIQEANERILLDKARGELNEEQYDEVKKTLSGVNREEARTLIAEADTGKANEALFDEGLGYMAEARKKLELNSRDYEHAISDYNAGAKIFKDLKSFAKHGDKASDRKNECDNWVKYLEAKSYLDAGDTESLKLARQRFESLTRVGEQGFENAVVMVNTTDQRIKTLEAETAYQLNALDEAEARYNELRELGDTEGADRGVAKVNNRRTWQAAQAKLDQGLNERNAALIAEAKEAFTGLNGFEGAGDKAAECDNAAKYLDGLQQMDERRYRDAQATFAALGDYADAVSRKDQADYCIQAEVTYNEAKTLMSVGAYDTAMQSFQKIRDFLDANGQAELCQQYLFYEDANNSIALGKMDAARKVLESLKLKGFEGAEARIADIDSYESAVVLQAGKDFPGAKEKFDALGSFYDAEKRAKECGDEITYTNAVAIMEQEPDTAKSMFEKIIGLHDDCYTLLQRCENLIAYRNAAAERDAGHYEKAYEMFSRLDKFGDSEAQAAALAMILDYRQAQEYASKGEYTKALDLLENQTSEEAIALMTDCRYQRGVQLEKEGHYDEALALYNTVQGYADSDSRARECGFQLFLGRMREKDSAMDEFQVRCFRFIYFFDGYSDKDAWGDCIIRRPQTGVDTPRSFAVSLDLAGVSMSNRDKVEALYQIMLGRSMDEEGANYIKALDNGMSMNYVIEQFRRSLEFELNCERLGVPTGEVVLTEARDANFYLTGYVFRCYHDLLGREQPAYQELNDWCSMYEQGAISLPDMIRFFATGQEMQERVLSNDDYITAVYRTLLDRDPDEGGRENAHELFRLGYTANDYLEAMLGSWEFANNLNEQNLPVQMPVPTAVPPEAQENNPAA